MPRSARDLIPEWSRDVWDIFVAPRYPLVIRSIGDRELNNWIEGGECSGLWETLDPFPAHVAMIWEELMVMKAPYPYNTVTRDDRVKVLKAWEKRFASARVRIEFCDVPEFSHSIARHGELPTTDLFVGHGQIARIQCWREADCRHRYHPYPGCEYSVREVVPVPPWEHMRYWLAEIQDGHHLFRAVLETTGRGNLGARGRVDVCSSQQIMEWFLPGAAKILPIGWDKLPLLIARAQIEGLFFRANQTRP